MVAGERSEFGSGCDSARMVCGCAMGEWLSALSHPRRGAGHGSRVGRDNRGSGWFCGGPDWFLRLSRPLRGLVGWGLLGEGLPEGEAIRLAELTGDVF